MRLIVRNTKEELRTINANISAAIGNGREYLEEKYWLTKNTDPVQYAMWCSESFKDEIISVIGQDEWDACVVTPNGNPEWYPPAPDKAAQKLEQSE